MIQLQYVRGTRWFGNCCCYCCCSSPAILPAGTRMYLTYDTIIMDFSPSHVPLLSPLNIYNSPPHPLHLILAILWTDYHTVPLGSSCRSYGPSPLRFTYHAGMRGAAGGRQPAAVKPPWYTQWCTQLKTTPWLSQFRWYFLYYDLISFYCKNRAILVPSSFFFVPCRFTWS